MKALTQKILKKAKIMPKHIAVIAILYGVFSFFIITKLHNFVSTCKYIDTTCPVEKTFALNAFEPFSFNVNPANSIWSGITLFFDKIEENDESLNAQNGANGASAENSASAQNGASASSSATNSSLAIQIIDENGVLVFAQKITNPKDNYYRFHFAKAINAKNGTYKVNVFGQNLNLHLDAQENAQIKLYGNIAKKFLVPLIVFCYLALSAVFALLYYFIFIKKLSTPTVFLVAGTIFGLFFMICMPPLSVGDECRHYDSAYILSNRLLGIENPGNWQMVKRVTDLNLVPDDYNQNENWTFFNYYENLWPHAISKLKEAKDTSLVLVYPYAITLTHYPALYFPSALALTVARLLKLNFLFTFLLGRFANLAFYVLLTYLGLKKLPKLYAPFFAFFALMPMMLHQAASFSYDSILLGASMFFIMRIVTFFMQKKALSIKELISLSLVAFIILPAKYVYFPLLVLFFVLPKECFSSNKKRLLYSAIFSLFLVASLSLEHFYSQTTPFTMPVASATTPIAKLDAKTGTITPLDVNGTVQKSANANTLQNIAINETNTLRERVSFKWIFTNPFDYAFILLTSLSERMTYLVETFAGGFLGWEAIPMNPLLVYSFVVLFFIYILKSGTDENALCKSGKMRIIIYGIFIFVCGAIMTGMYTDGVDPLVPVIGGLQGRYFLPILPLLYLAKKRVGFTEEAKDELILFQLLVQVVFALDLVYRIVGIF